MPFQYPIHNQIIEILKAVNRDFFRDCSIYFGDGTMLALEYGEYRLSRDIDFLCPYGEPFSRLRRYVFDRGYGALFDLDNRCEEIRFPRDLRTDRDGVRFAVQHKDSILLTELSNGAK